MVWFLASVPIGILMFRLVRFLSTPLLRAIGFYRYHSPMFFTMPFGAKTLDMHLGTTWDFMQLRDRSVPTMFRHVCSGLLDICDKVEAGQIAADVRLRATMYFLSAERLQRFGFTCRRMNVAETVAFLANYAEVCFLQSLMKQRICLINIRDVRIVTVRGSELLQQRSTIAGVRAALARGLRSGTEEQAHGGVVAATVAGKV
ncbi:MAG: hypothetical protein MUC47_02505 [Candidatus Kapabacteria bacterium]|jgi:hypothetical protein|nr:hypothetical protein [Candidatus Kapabacteria bacterium]